MTKDEFYIGYLPEAPKGLSKIIRNVSIVIGLGVIIVCVLVTLNQNKFSSSTFEFGLSTSIEGTFFQTPVPHVDVVLGKDVNGNNLEQTILLVGFGKMGAEGAMKLLEQKAGSPIQGRRIQLSGSLIYGDNKAILQVDEKSNLKVLDDIENKKRLELDGQARKIPGSIIDPKCFFGVMKPGEGKPHRSCAIRCISGGIPPVFKSGDQYFVLIAEGADESTLSSILTLVDDGIILHGSVTEFSGWQLLTVQQSELRQLAKSKKSKEYLIAYQKGITTCTP